MKANLRKVVTMPAWYEKFRIPAELIDEAGVRHVTDREARNLCRLDALPDKKLDGEAFPYFDREGKLTEYLRVRLDVPYADEKGKEHRYHGVSKRRTQRVLYYPPGAPEKLKSKQTTILLVEAEKSALALEAWARRTGRADILSLGMGGCQGWQQKDAKGHPGVLPDLDVCDGRRVIVMVDSNWATNYDVRNARDKLVVELSGRRCSVLVASLPQEKGVNGPDDYLAAHKDDGDMAAVLNAAMTGEVAPYSEQALALRFAREHVDKALYVPGVGYHAWDGQRWKPDEGAVDTLAHVLCKTAASECGKAALADRVRSRRMREAILREARPYLTKQPSEMDRNPALLGTPGGVVDLETGKLREARQGDYLTMSTAVAPDFDHEPTRWLKFLEEVTKHNQKLIAYLQRVFGYALTGEIREHALFYFDGAGRNGKSTLIETLTAVFGDYAGTAPMAMFLAQPFEEHSTGTAALRGKRLVTASETRAGQAWDEEKLKRYSGGDTLTARFMRKDYVSFVPDMTIALSGNHRPRFRNIDDAIRDRFFVIPFRQHFAREDDKGRLKQGSKLRDTKLKDTLREEHGGILAWAIAGARQWFRDGLRTPQIVKDVTADYLAEQDNVKLWADEKFVPRTNKADAPATAAKSHADYTAWCLTHREYPVRMDEFLRRLDNLQYRKTHVGGVTTFPDVRLKGWRADGS